MFLRLFQHLLPNARAWRLTVINKQLREFFEGLGNSLGDPVKLFYDEIFSDIDPQQTRELDVWEKQFGLAAGALTEQQRRDRLDATWKAKGGQSPTYIQETLQASGFDVYVHEWWVPGSEPAVGVLGSATARVPQTYLNDNVSDIEYLSADGASDMQDGDIAIAMDGATTSPTGYPLVNKIFVFDPDYLAMDGGADMQDGDIAIAMDGGLGPFGQYTLKKYVIEAVPANYAYFLYIGGETFPNHATVQGSRKNEFETLCLKICPAQQWLGMLIDYS